MYVTNDSITTRFETMTNKELGAFIRAELKKIGITSRMVSTRVSDCGYSTSVDCYIKDLSVDFETVRKIVEQVEYVRYDPYAQEILSGCNIFTENRQERCHPKGWLMNCRNFLLTINI